MSDPRDEKRAREAAAAYWRDTTSDSPQRMYISQDTLASIIARAIESSRREDREEIKRWIVMHKQEQHEANGLQQEIESLRVEMLGYYEQQARAEAAEREIKRLKAQLRPHRKGPIEREAERLKAQLRPHRKGPIVAGVGVPLCDACGKPWPCIDSTRISG